MDHLHHSVPEATGLTWQERLADVFSQYGFMPHGHCYLWKPALVSIHVVSDFLIGLAYVCISLTLYGLVKRINLSFNRIVLFFGVFIGACGMTHFMEIWNLWNADYWWSAWVKVITAAASVGTGVYLYRLRDTFVQIAEAAKMAEERRISLEQLTQELEIRVAERTALLSESEAKFRTITDVMPQIVWSTLPNGQHDYFNDRWYEFTGAHKGESDGSGWTRTIHPDDRERALRIWNKSLEEGSEYEIEYRIRHHSGSFRWALARAMPVRDDQGQIIRWMGTCTDIHEHKLVQERLRAALRARDEFLSIASHELKTPLTTMLIQAQLQKRLIDSEDQKAYLPERINKISDQNEKLCLRLDRLVNDMLDISRIRTGQLQLEKEDVDLNALITNLLEHMKPQLIESGYDLPTFRGQRCIGYWDPGRLEQVISNLLNNAIRYGERKPISVILEAGAEAKISIIDHGMGINPAVQEAIFNRFERAVSANDISGLGLGLFITKQIVESHGGSVSVKSEPGKGSTFMVTLPFAVATLSEGR